MAIAGEDRVRKAIDDIEAQKSLLGTCSLLLSNLSSHFSALNTSLLHKSQALDSKLQALDSLRSQTLASLSRRESSLSSLQSAASASILRLRSAALTEFESAPAPSVFGEDFAQTLRSLCRRMDAAALWKFLVARRKDLAALKCEAPRALAFDAVDPSRLVLDALEDFVSRSPNQPGLSDHRWACSVLLRALSFPPTSNHESDPPAAAEDGGEGAAVGSDGAGGEECREGSAVGRGGAGGDGGGESGPLGSNGVELEKSGDGDAKESGAGEGGIGGSRRVARTVVERAVGITEAWKGRIEEREGEGAAGAAEVQMFLQMVATFGIQDRFDEGFLRRLLVKHPTRREMAKLVKELGFGDRMGDISNELIKSGKEIEAIYLVHEASLTERFPPVSLLKDYLKNSRKSASAILKNGHYSSAAIEDAGNIELNSLKAMIKCVEDHKLESVFALESHRKRVSQLEKARLDRKKNASTSKNKNKRARPSGSGTAFLFAKAGRLSAPWEAPTRPNVAVGHPASFNYASHGGAYEVPPAVPYGSPFGAGPRGHSPAALPQQYSSYVTEDVNMARTTGSYGQQASYTGYDYNAGVGAGARVGVGGGVGAGVAPPYQSSYPH